jgi:hypothetical protein
MWVSFRWYLRAGLRQDRFPAGIFNRIPGALLVAGPTQQMNGFGWTSAGTSCQPVGRAAPRSFQEQRESRLYQADREPERSADAGLTAQGGANRDRQSLDRPGR